MPIINDERIKSDALNSGANAYYTSRGLGLDHENSLKAGLKLIQTISEANGIIWNKEINAEMFLFLEKKVIITETGSSTVLTRKNFRNWFIKEDWKDKLPRWNRYLDFKRAELPEAVIEAIDIKTDEILGMMGDPRPALGEGSKFDIRGMVVGYVQSGKTGNYTGLINKAIDAGYRYIIVLTGMHDNLRSQTQERIDEGVVGVIFRKRGVQNRIGIGTKDGWRANTMPMTTYAQDFLSSKVTFNILNDDVRVWVVKKNKIILENVNLVLQNLIETNRNSDFVSVDSNGTERLSRIPLLLIDDECDQASINTKIVPLDEDGKPAPEYDPTAINLLIRSILNKFDAKTYVGYTATPFANIFIKPDVPEDRVGEDLFPKDFIVMMKKPSNYVGPLEVFGGLSPNDIKLPITRDIFSYPDKELQIFHKVKANDRLEGKGSISNIYKERGYDIIQWNDLMPDSGRYSDIILKEGASLLVGEGFMPGKHDKYHIPEKHLLERNAELPLSLRHAIGSFIIGCSVRILRGQEDQHMSMLIHVTRFTNVQKKLAELVINYCVRLFDKINNNDSDTLSWLKELWEQDFKKTSERMQCFTELENFYYGVKYTLDKINHSWKEVEPFLKKAIEKLTAEDKSKKPNVREINGSSKDLLDYYKYKEKGMGVIVIGGDKLSRGLTLEGLMVSYYLRLSSAYDTLMQMGRWFGYRDGFIDICRIYANQELLRNYSHVAIAFEELRDMFKEMAAEGKSPDEFGLKVKDHPSMIITNLMKMRYTQTNELDFSGKLSETVAFWNRPDKIRMNIEATEKLIQKLGPSDKELERNRQGNYIWSNVSVEDILCFIGMYMNHPSSTKMRTEAVTEYINKAKNLSPPELTSWTVVLNGLANGDPIDLANLKVVPIGRSITSTSPDRISTGVISGNLEEQFDFSKSEIERIKNSDYKEYQLLQQDNNKESLSFNKWLRLKYRDKSKGILLLYPIRFLEDGCRVNYPTEKGSYLIGFAIVTPSTQSGITAKYVLNEIACAEYFDNQDK